MAVLAIAATVLLIPLSFIRHLQVYQPLWPQLLAYGTLMAVVAAEAVLVVRHRSWPVIRWAALAAVFGAALLSRAFLPAGATVSAADWIFGALGWTAAILLLDRSLWYLVAFLALHEACTVVKVLVTGPATSDVLLNLAAGSLGTIGYPLASGIAALALRRVAVAADRASQEAEQARTANAVEAEVHAHRQRRFADLYESAGPLLQALAERTIDLEATDAQHRCAVEAARMRRLFAETDTAADPLVHELTQSADVAGRKGVVVDLEARGTWPEMPVPIRRALTEPIVKAMSTAISEARITVVGTPGVVSVNVVADCAPVDIAEGGSAVRVISLSEDGFTWVEAQWTTT
ncbi:hypothetical protein [Plantactinospora endophytica]|uniref:Uncharacterized protein n=1 Tax=Plantactinospora endophytica TaxID=673535 RepID=A0ABQ4EES8_9ACTN|nr:hypothetical protein [Plantactinospora endophytica]GIG93238.1 hypothetical protein Pen02_81740 [Plantactinospora endophytica]